MMIERIFPVRCARLVRAVVVIAAIAMSCLPAFAQYVPTDPDALRRMMQQKRQQREAAEKNSTNPADGKEKSAQDKTRDRQRDLLNSNAKAVEHLQELIASGKQRDAFNDLMQLRQMLGEPRLPGIEAMAAEAAGRALMALKRYKDALDAFHFAEKYAHSQLSDYVDSSPLKELLAKVRADIKDAQRAFDIERFGKAFVRFRDAEILRKQKSDYKGALAVYQEVIDKNSRWYQEEAIADPGTPGNSEAADAKQVFEQLQQLDQTQEIRNPFVEASRLYAVLCLAELGKTGEAITALRKFAEDEPKLGLYKGEAWLELGRIAIERQFDPQSADKYLQKCDEWMTSVRQLEQTPAKDAYSIVLDLPGVRKKATGQINPPEKERHKDYWGNIKKNPIDPGELVNRKTCPWYLDDLEEQCAKFRGFLAFAQGDGKAAMNQWERLTELDPLMNDIGTLATNPNDYHRLKFGADHSYFVAYPQDLALYQGRQRFALLLGDFYYVTQQFDHAVEICERLLKSDRDIGRLTPAQQDYVHYLCGASLYRGRWKAGGNSADLAMAEMERVLTHKDETMSEPRAMMAIANLGRSSRTKKLQDRAMAMLETLATDTRYGHYTYVARIEMGIELILHGDKEEGVRWLRSIPESEKAYHALADRLMTKLSKQKIGQTASH